MARPRKQTVDYFPHDTDVSSGKTLTILQSKYGNDGYAFWFKLLRMPGVTIAVIRKNLSEDAGLPKDIKGYISKGWTQEQIKDYFWGCEAFRKLWGDMEMQEATLDELIRQALLDYVSKP